MGIEDKIENIFDQIGEGVIKGFFKINALPSYLNPEIKKGLSRYRTNLSQGSSYVTEGVLLGAYLLNSIPDKRWLLVPLMLNAFSFYCESSLPFKQKK